MSRKITPKRRLEIPWDDTYHGYVGIYTNMKESNFIEYIMVVLKMKKKDGSVVQEKRLSDLFFFQFFNNE